MKPQLNVSRFLFSFLPLIGVAFAQLAVAENPSYRMVFTGDILLSREVNREIKLRHGASPWGDVGGFFKGADWVMGNLEGSVGEAVNCLNKSSPLCFAVSPSNLSLLKEAGFTAMGVENNHSADLGDSGRALTLSSLTSAGLSPVDFSNSPGFLRLGQYTVAVIALSNVAGQDGKSIQVPSSDLRQKLRLAHALADWVVVYVHWGVELSDWVQPKQRDMAEWLANEGADLIVGHHPHVVQKPECINGKPVFFSLGNHVFDQKYPETKSGMMADCKISSEGLSCFGVATTTQSGSSFPTLEKNLHPNASLDCRVKPSGSSHVDGYKLRPRLDDHQYADGEIVLEGKKARTNAWSVVAKRLLSVEIGRLSETDKKKELLFTLEKHPSSIDQEIGPRPYVYEVTRHGLVAKWRGSALAYPLLDAQLLHSKTDSDLLCALHRADSFLLLNPSSTGVRTAVYRWNGFGFTGVEDQAISKRCQALFVSAP